MKKSTPLWQSVAVIGLTLFLNGSLLWGDQAKDAPELKGITLGDTLLFHRYTGAHFPVDGVDYWIMKSSQILGKATKLPDFVIKGADSSLQHFPANNPLAA